MKNFPIEYEAKFKISSIDNFRSDLQSCGAKLLRHEYFQKRVVFHLPKGHEIEGGVVRVRDEGDKITLSLKVHGNERIEQQKEVYLEVSNFDSAVLLLKAMGCVKKAYIETKREKWDLNGVEIDIDQWPFLEPFIEIEGKSAEDVKNCAQTLGLDFAKAIFGAVDQLYAQKYGISEDQINNHTPKITFADKNPFI